MAHCIGCQKNNTADHLIFYLGTLTKTGSESIEATLRRRWILFAGFVARIEDTRLPKCVMFGELAGGAGCVRGQGKSRLRVPLDELRAFGINVDQWATAAQDKGECRKTAEQRGRKFHGEMDRCRESRGWDTTRNSMPERDGKDSERIAQSKHGRNGLLAIVD